MQTLAMQVLRNFFKFILFYFKLIILKYFYNVYYDQFFIDFFLNRTLALVTLYFASHSLCFSIFLALYLLAFYCATKLILHCSILNLSLLLHLILIFRPLFSSSISHHKISFTLYEEHYAWVNFSESRGT